jgi:CheY-like chemotaxis protein
MMHLLLIEDNPRNAELFIQMLRHQGYQVTHEITGVGGLMAARRSPEAYDGYLIDFNLPDLDGLQVGLTLCTLMQQKRLKTAPLIALTAQTDKATQVRAERMGFDAFIGKPCTEEDLQAVIQQLTGGASHA